MTESSFEQSFDHQLRAYAEGGVQPFDRYAIAGSLISSGFGPRRLGWLPAFRRPAVSPALALVMMGLLLAALALAAVGSGRLRQLLPDPVPSIVTPQPVPPPTASFSQPATPTPTTDPNALQIVVFGDGMVTYAGEGDREPTYPELYGDLVEAATGRQVEVRTFGHPSWVTASALTSMRTLEPGYPSDVLDEADIVLITIGAKDGDPYRELPSGACTTPVVSSEVAWECVAAYAPDFGSDLHALIDELSLYSGEPAVRVTAPEFNRFIGSDRAPSPAFGREIFVNVAFAMQRVACETAPNHGQRCTGIVELFNGPDGLADPAPYLERDRLNLNMTGRQLLAEAVFASGLEGIHPGIRCIESGIQVCPTPGRARSGS